MDFNKKEINLEETNNLNPLNRAYEKRRDTDKIIIPKIGLYDVDYAILYFLNKKIDLNVEESNGQVLDIETSFVNAESWYQIQNRGYLRDGNGKLITPLAYLKRNAINEWESFKFRTGEGIPRIVHKPDVNLENQRNFFYKLRNSKPSQEYYLSVIPRFFKIDYELFIWTDFQEQMNKVIQQVLRFSNYEWGDQFKFRTTVTTASPEVTLISGEDRLVRAVIPLQVFAGLSEEFELKKSTVEKAFTIKRVVFRTDRSSFDAHVVESSDEIPD